jgi:hypothetical protein
MMRYGYSPEHAKAIELLRSEWVPLKALAFPGRETRLPLALVIDFLAFGAANPPSDISPLMCAAHRTQVFKALCAAARNNRVKLFGTPQAGGPRQRIRAIEFDQEFSLADENNAIGLDPNVTTVERFAELLQPNHWLWRDVHVDRRSLVNWLKTLPAKARRQARARGIIACKEWLIEKRESGPQEKRKEEYKTEAARLFGVGPDQFRNVWKAAAATAPSEDWGKPGIKPGKRKSSGK